MGAASFVAPRLHALIAGRAVRYEMISRAESASPATGSHKAHVIEQQEILGKAFGRSAIAGAGGAIAASAASGAS